METADVKEKEVFKRTIGKIILTLENAILSQEKLENPTVSQEDGLPRVIELDLRILGCELIQTAGILLKLPQVSKIKPFIRLFTSSGSFHARHIVNRVVWRKKFNDCNRFLISRWQWHRDKCFSSVSSTQSPSYVTTWKQSRWAASVWRQKSRKHRDVFVMYSTSSITSSKSAHKSK